MPASRSRGVQGVYSTENGFAAGSELWDEHVATRWAGLCRPEPVPGFFHSMQENTDVGHCLSDFIYYRLLAEAERSRGAGKKQSRVLSVHCPSVDQDLSQDYVVEALRAIIVHIGGGIE
ncbi:hypothetical protein FISHEDRAFT_74296 [Fistulina hepatica ATCC 64428]|uniref:Uncharacterized protein n=1 Tax=Fistulina hepatica ATCC 64428 TaxID=1128425 RepID=A0A0D7A9T0_9AGAR|nr:hypothetical protein FISHEDRAFT_74296 [Fistulina hepatica ATCC 64428]